MYDLTGDKSLNTSMALFEKTWVPKPNLPGVTGREDLEI
jgi:hypothetical protein